MPNRRDALKGLGALGASVLLRIDTDAQGEGLIVAGQRVELRVADVSHTVRISIVPGGSTNLNPDGGLVEFTEQRRAVPPGGSVRAGHFSLEVTGVPLNVRVSHGSEVVQEIGVTNAIDRPVDLTTTPIYVRAGAVVPMGPVKQYTAQPSDGPLSLTVYPGADGRFELFEDDGTSFEYRRGNWMGMSMAWDDRRRRLTLSLAAGSKMRPPMVRDLEVRVAGQKTVQSARFSGRPLVIAPGS